MSAISYADYSYENDPELLYHKDSPIYNDYVRAYKLYDKNDVDGAINAIKDYLNDESLDNKSKAAIYGSLGYFYENKDNKKSDYYYSVLNNKFPNSYEHKIYQDRMNTIERDRRVSFDELREIIKSGDKNKSIKRTVTFINYGTYSEDKIKAIDLLSKKFLDIDTIPLKLVLIDSLISNTEFEKASSLLDDLLSKNKGLNKNKDFLMRTLKIYSHNASNKTIGIYEKLLTFDLSKNEKLKIYTSISEYYMNKGDYESAIKYTDKALDNCDIKEFRAGLIDRKANLEKGLNFPAKNDNNTNSDISNKNKYIVLLITSLIIIFIIINVLRRMKKEKNV